MNQSQTLNTHASHQDGCVVARISGELDVATAGQARMFLTDLLGEAGVRLVADVSDLAFTDAAGITVLLAASAQAVQGGGWLRLVGARPHLLRVLGILDLDGELPAYGSVRAAALARHDAAEAV
jgi:anti-sigma B factor antagonist